MEIKHSTKEYVVAFIDVLGAKNKIKEDVNKSLNIVHQAYDEAIAFLDSMYSGETRSLRPEIRIFSDNIVIAVDTSIKDRSSALVAVLIYAGLIQHQFLHNRYLVRGGISMGEFFIDDIMLWGTALTRAYEIENSISIYPRIVLDPRMVGEIRVVENPVLSRWIKQDVDHLLFVHYMQDRTLKEKDKFILLLLIRLKEADELLKEVNGNLKVQQKILWHISYLQNILEKYNQSE
ncbi:MAG: hypothetical protein IJN10_08270 [Firmicutes bacterium]|nr:hypothetical protein [Bacillota bacterium]